MSEWDDSPKEGSSELDGESTARPGSEVILSNVHMHRTRINEKRLRRGVWKPSPPSPSRLLSAAAAHECPRTRAGTRHSMVPG
jgi:hypothetical protein